MSRAWEGLSEGETRETPPPSPRAYAYPVVRQLYYFCIHAQGMRERYVRAVLLLCLAPLRWIFWGLGARHFALRLIHLPLRGMSRDRLDFLGEELAPTLPPAPPCDHLTTRLLDHVARPLARAAGVRRVVCPRMEFRDGIATGRLEQAEFTTGEPAKPAPAKAIVLFENGPNRGELGVVRALSGKQILLVGGTGFIGKVWLSNVLRHLPEIGAIHLLVRKKGPISGEERVRRMWAESPLFEGLPPERLARVRVVEGDMCLPGLGLAPEVKHSLAASLDLIVNSGGITEFGPDVRWAAATNVDATLHVIDFLRGCAHAALLHLSTCYVAGRRNGRIAEQILPDYNPRGDPTFDAEKERNELARLVRAEESKEAGGGLRQRLIRLGMNRAVSWGWPNTYTYTKSLAESLLLRRGAGLPIAVVRPSIVETSTQEPFRGWNEGINTSAPLSWLLGTYFRQLPTNGRKRLDIVPVDLVTRAMTLISAALVERRHDPLYQIATSSRNPCDMRRSIELTGLAHRKHYRTLPGVAPWLRRQFDTIGVSGRRYRRFSAPRQKAVVRVLGRVLPFARAPLRRAEKSLDRVEKLIELYRPFILENDQIFESERIEKLTAALSPEERARFGCDPGRIDWSEYWIDIHIPALRRWSFPLLEGRGVKA